MQNMRIRFGTVRTRAGTSAVFATTGKVPGIFNWIAPDGTNWVLYQDGTIIKSYKQATSVISSLFTAQSTTRAPSIAPFDVWSYIAGFDTSGNGTFQTEIFDGVNVDKAFAGPPVLVAATAVDGGPGQCTAGQHFIGFVYQNRTGYSGVPVTAVSGVPISVTLNAGLRQINISVSLPALADGGTDANGKVQATLFLIATRADNPAIWYFMSDYALTGQIGEQPVPLNTPTTLNFVMSLSDEDIADAIAGDTAQDNFLYLSQDSTGAGPFNPSFVVAYGNRMCYGTGTILYVSNQQNPQQIAADQNAVQMLNQRQIGYAFPLAGNPGLYLTGDRWTGYVTDNNDIPATWAPPVPVSTTLGAPFPNLVCAATGGPWAWIVTEAGPYYFDGNYGLNPLTYLVSGYDENGAPIGWKRVNWAAAYAITIVDDVQNLKLYVAVPLDGATEPNFEFVIDYRMGKQFDSVDISLDLFTPRLFSSIAVVQEYASGLTNVWKGPASTGSVTRFDVTTHNDLGAAIDGFWVSGLTRGPNITSAMVRVGSLDIWARGNAPLDSEGNPTLLITLYGIDNQVQVPITLLSTQGVASALTQTPGIIYMSKFDIHQLNDYYYGFRTNSVDAWFELSSFRSYERQDLFNR